MKLSNKILIGFFGFIFIYMTAAFTEMRFKGDLNRIDEHGGMMETAELRSIGYVKVSDLTQRVIITSADNPGIEVKSKSGKALQSLDYEVVGDTLLLKSFNLDKGDPAAVTILLTDQNLRGLEVQDTHVTLKKLVQDSLNVSQSGGHVWFDEANQIAQVTIEAKDQADVFVYTGLDILHVETINSHVVIQSSIGLLSGKISSQSQLVAYGAEEVRLSRDSSSDFRLN
ncbi:MAG: hypothetical protein AAFX57_00340 [Bacteroidota bacterium]